MKTQVRPGKETITLSSKIEKSPPLADQAYNIIKDMIVSNKMAPQEMLLENQLAKMLGVSRSPLREALTRLCQDGFVEFVPWKGARVTKLTPRYVREVYELRMALECMAARKAAALLEDRELEEMEKALESERPVVTEWDIPANRELEIRFHRLTIDKWDNNMMKDIYNRLLDHISRIQTFAGTIPENMLASYEEHWKILASMRTRDPNAIAEAIRTHIINIINRVTTALE